MEQTTPNSFREEQRFRKWWVWLIIGFVALFQWRTLLMQVVLGRPVGDNPAADWMVVLLWLLFGIGFPLFFLYLRLAVTVTDQAVDIHFRPLVRRAIPIADVARAEARNYAALREYGGWGIRGRGDKRAYNVSGDRGVELILTDGRKVMIGSQRADELARAIVAAQET
jgi:hypothetical protein